MKLCNFSFKVCVISICAWYSLCAFHFITVCPSRDPSGVHYSLTPKPICGDSFCSSREEVWSFVGIGTSFECFRDSCKTARRVIATFLHFLQRVLRCCKSLFLHFKVCFLPNPVRNSRKRSLLYTFLWKLVPGISWVNDEGMEECAPLWTIPIVLEHSSDYCFDWLCCHENRGFLSIWKSSTKLNWNLVVFSKFKKNPRKQEHATRGNKRWHTSTFLWGKRDLKFHLFWFL